MLDLHHYPTVYAKYGPLPPKALKIQLNGFAVTSTVCHTNLTCECKFIIFDITISPPPILSVHLLLLLQVRIPFSFIDLCITSMKKIQLFYLPSGILGQ